MVERGRTPLTEGQPTVRESMKQSKGSASVRNCSQTISSVSSSSPRTRLTRLLEVDDILDPLDSLLLNLCILRLAILLVPAFLISSPLLPQPQRKTHASVIGNKSRTARTGCFTHARSSSSKP